MIKIYLLLLTGALSLSAVYSQEKTNLVKLNLFPLTAGNLSIEYERPIAKRITVNGTLSWRPQASLPYKSIWESIVEDEEGVLETAKLGAFSMTPEVRFYLGKKDVFKGFYIAPFIKYSHYNTKLNVSYDDEFGVEKNLPIEGGLNALTGGFSVGNQWHLSKNLSLDWRIIGPNYGFSNGKFESKTNLNSIEQQEIREQLGDLDLVIVKTELEVNGDGATLRTKGGFTGIRTALSIGYRF